MFDSHHLDPLACGIRESRIDDFAVLCPTCHRWAHVHGVDRLQPLAVNELRAVRIESVRVDAAVGFALASSPDERSDTRVHMSATPAFR